MTERRLPSDAALAVERYLQWRKTGCQHFRLPLQTYRDRAGAERCLSCHDVVPFLKAPLFLGRRGRRVGPQWLRQEFRGVRRRLRFPPGVRFSSLGGVAPQTPPPVPGAAAGGDEAIADRTETSGPTSAGAAKPDSTRRGPQ